MNEPIADAVRGILDGHIVLDRKIAERGQYPAINVLKSISRVMNVIATDEHKQIATGLRTLLATYEENNELISIGAYKKGTNPEVDLAVSSYPKIVSFLKQGVYEQVSFEETVQMMRNLVE